MDAKQIMQAIHQADSERHPSQQAYFIDEDLADLLIDGRINLERVAEILSEQIDKPTN